MTPSMCGVYMAWVACSALFYSAFFATTAVNPDGAQGLMTGETSFFMKQVLAAIGAAAYAFILRM